MLPSEEHAIEMFPMDFEEFLWAMGDEMLMPYIRMRFDKRLPMEAFHRRAMDYFRQYLIVGGMPQAVAKYVETRDNEKEDEVKRDILALYRNDIHKYADNQETVENIVAQMLRAAGHRLYFFSNSSRTSADDRMEIDFLIAKPVTTSRHNISPIEVKSGQRYAMNSLRKCIAKYGSQLSTPYVLHDKGVKTAYLPGSSVTAYDNASADRRQNFMASVAHTPPETGSSVGARATFGPNSLFTGGSSHSPIWAQSMPTPAPATTSLK